MKKMILDRRQWTVFGVIAGIITLPLLLLTLAGQIQGESGLIMVPVLLLGLPWGLLWLVLPIEIPGWNAPPPPGENLPPLSVLGLFGFLFPIYVNIYLFCLRAVPRKKNMTSNEDQSQTKN